MPHIEHVRFSHERSFLLAYLLLDYGHSVHVAPLSSRPVDLGRGTSIEHSRPATRPFHHQRCSILCLYQQESMRQAPAEWAKSLHASTRCDVGCDDVFHKTCLHRTWSCVISPPCRTTFRATMNTSGSSMFCCQSLYVTVAGPNPSATSAAAAIQRPIQFAPPLQRCGLCQSGSRVVRSLDARARFENAPRCFEPSLMSDV